MKTRDTRPNRRAMGAWLAALGAVGCFVLGSGTVRAADTPTPVGPAIEARDISENPQSLSIGGPRTATAETAGGLAPFVTCPPLTALTGTIGSTSNNGRAPLANYRGIRTVYLISAAELALNGLPSGVIIQGIGWHYTTAPGVAATGTLTVYLQNTIDTTYNKGTTFTTAIAGMTTVHNASTTLPNSTTAFDIPFTGGSTFIYTGGGLYVAFDWRYPAGTLGAGVIECNNTLASGLAGSQTTSTPPAPDAPLSPSAFRPVTRLSVSVNNDVSVDYVISYGSLAKPLVGPQTVQAVVTNRGGNAQSNVPVTLNLTGAETFTDTKIVPALASCGGQTVVTFAPFTPSAIGGDTVTVSVPPDDAAGNNSKSRPLDETFNLYSYKHPGTAAAGGVGVTSNTGDFVAKFTTTVAAKVSAISLEFPVSNPAAAYRVAIYPDSGSGTPGLVPIYEDAFDRAGPIDPGPVTIALPAPVAVGPGIFFAGVEQTNTINLGMGYDAEVPIRAGSFYVAIPHPAAAWTDFAPGNNFKANIGVTLVQCATAAECNDNNACTDDACTNSLCVNTNNNQTSCDGNSCSNPDQCLNGTCIPGPNPCNDNNACTVDLCDGQGGCVYSALDCNDNNACTDDSCIPGSGCAHGNHIGACSDGNPCTLGDACSGAVCVPGSASLPAAVQFCNSNPITIPPVGTATPYPSSIVVTGQPSYVCSTTVNLNGITHAYPDDIDMMLARLSGANAVIMSDVGGGTAVTNVNLTLKDAAVSGLPDAGPLVAGTFRPTNFAGTGTEAWAAPAPTPGGGSALSAFTGSNPNGTWNLFVVDDESPDGGSLAGWCLNLVSICITAADCDDGNPCTSDVCTNSLCTHPNNSAACNDNNACTSNDTCLGGVCVGGAPPACNDGNACTGNNCNPVTGLCENPPIVCNDNNACTDDSCNTGSGCVFTPDDGNACSDNSLCTSPDVCQNGVCVGQNPVVCTPDANACTTEACDPASGGCVSISNTNACDDGDACTTGDICGPALAESFDGEIAPNLPGVWTSSVVAGTGDPWSTTDTSFDTAPNSAFGFDGAAVADEVLISPPISITSPTAKLTFRNRWSFESPSCFDAGVLEIDIAGLGFVDIVTAGGSFASGGYTGTVASSFMNPLANRSAWCNVSAGYPAYLTTVVNLPAAAAGQTIQLQWRIGTDNSTGAPGQNIDSIVLVDGGHRCIPGAAVNCDDNNPCTDDSCDAQSGCQHANNNNTCDDGDLCTVLDACSAGSCGGVTVVCDDSNPCTTDVCNPALGCTFTNNTAACDDGNACTAGDTCASGVCNGGTPITAPPEPQNMTAAANKLTYSWSAANFATQYDCVRGGLATLPVGPGGGDERGWNDLAGTTMNDVTVPTPGTGFWYVSRGQNSCGSGSYGNQGVHGAPGALRVTTTCP